MKDQVVQNLRIKIKNQVRVMSVNIFVNSPGASLLPRDYFSQITHANKS